MRSFQPQFLGAMEHLSIDPGFAHQDVEFRGGIRQQCRTPVANSQHQCRFSAVQAPQAICEITATNVNRTMLINPNTPAFDKREPRQAMALSLDRQVFIDILARG
jgi:hypothetical protein